jgi:hypothetical protein
METGDILLFQGKGLISAAIMHFTKSPWSHVGMVIKSDIGVLVWESTTLSNIPDIVSGKCRKGVQLTSLADRISAYDGIIGYRKLTTERDADFHAKLAEFRAECRGKPYEKNRMELIRSALDGKLFAQNTEDLSSLFCSELVAEMYQRWGFMPDSIPSNEYTPADFAAYSDFIGGSLSHNIIELI